jgi:hypothetical protein
MIMLEYIHRQPRDDDLRICEVCLRTGTYSHISEHCSKGNHMFCMIGNWGYFEQQNLERDKRMGTERIKK